MNHSLSIHILYVLSLNKIIQKYAGKERKPREEHILWQQFMEKKVTACHSNIDRTQFWFSYIYKKYITHHHYLFIIYFYFSTTTAVLLYLGIIITYNKKRLNKKMIFKKMRWWMMIIWFIDYYIIINTYIWCKHSSISDISKGLLLYIISKYKTNV